MMDLAVSNKFPANRCMFYYTYSNGVSIVTLPFTFEQVEFGHPFDAIYDNYSIIGTTVEILPEGSSSLILTKPEHTIDDLPNW
jgi:hypothetical protein